MRLASLCAWSGSPQPPAAGWRKGRVTLRSVKKLLAATAALAVTAVPLLVTAPAGAHPPKDAYRTCKELNKHYHHGVGRVGARDRLKKGSKAKPVTNWTRNTRVYHLNDGRVGTTPGKGQFDLDRDNDGIACEKH
jgi:hypothetical protein